jgi:hypothetical protein
MNRKTFPKLQFIFLFGLFMVYSCEQKAEMTIESEQFIEIYSKLLIINEMGVSKEYRDRLLDELYTNYDVNLAQIDSTLAYLNRHPQEWVEVLAAVKDSLQKMKSEHITKKSESGVISEPDSFRKKNTMRRMSSQKELRDRQRKSKVIKEKKRQLREPK